MQLVIKYVSNAWSIIIIITTFKCLLNHAQASNQSFVVMMADIKATQHTRSIRVRGLVCSHLTVPFAESLAALK
jgi:hypothetical protein